jgi:phytoene desaturase
MYVLEPVPHTGSGIDWRRESGPMRERLHAFLEAGGYPTDVREELFVGPDDWQAQGLHLGTPFALAHTFLQSGPFRPSNVDRRVPGLVFAGSGTQPGVGIPMVLVSGKLAAQRVQEYAGAARPVPRTVVR